MDYIIREIKKEEYDLLNDFLYNAIYIPDGVEPPPKSIINCPELQEYVFEFGSEKMIGLQLRKFKEMLLVLFGYE